MKNSEVLVEIWRGKFLESQHLGDAVVVNSAGQVVHAWGNPEKIVLPRSACKMIQALPLIESGAAEAAKLTNSQLALSCSSHNGAYIHTGPVTSWMTDLGLTDDDFRCGAHMPKDPEASTALIKTDTSPCQWHNNCSGKHMGFLTLNKHLGGGAEYLEADHPVQKAVRAAFEDVCEMDSPGYVIDGCSAPNFAASLMGLARAMAFFANAKPGGPMREQAAVRLREAMATHPELVAGEGRACTELMRATDGRVTIKTGAEGVFMAIIPELGMGVAMKIEDGSFRGADAAIAAILVKLGVLDLNHPGTKRFLNAPVTNWRDMNCGTIRAADALL